MLNDDGHFRGMRGRDFFKWSLNYFFFGCPNQASEKEMIIFASPFEMMRCKCCLPRRDLCAHDPYTLVQSSPCISRKMARLGTGKTLPEVRINTKDVDRRERVPRRTKKMAKGLGSLPCEQKLRELCLFSLEKKKA